MSGDIMDRWAKLASELTFYKGHRNNAEYTPFDDDHPWTPEMEGMSIVESGSREGQIISSLVADSTTGASATIWGMSGLHKVALDIDMECVVTPSSTPGHHHLYIDKVMPWGKYLKLLIALADAGIIEGGYLDVSQRRKATHLRAPWYKKS
jgi:hypothetical protein